MIPHALFERHEGQEFDSRGLFGDRLTLYGNIYIAPFHAQKGAKLGMHGHRFNHLGMIWRGSFRVYTKVDETVVSKDYRAPDRVILKRTETHSIEALEDDSLWFCMFAIRDEEGQAMEEVYGPCEDPRAVDQTTLKYVVCPLCHRGLKGAQF